MYNMELELEIFDKLDTDDLDTDDHSSKYSGDVIDHQQFFPSDFSTAYSEETKQVLKN
jgi:hypothetical protein